jgi:hypothetical protein
MAKLRRAIVRAGGRETEGKWASEDPHPKAELRWQLAAAAERRGGGCAGNRNAAAMVARLGLRGRGGSGCGICGA